ncbi:hypothetical protein IW261DRAFT_1461947 [Armillaria novae-zelandiae]|uniref:Uncharacterized protein n=1 Tax=Armillaria novae-zelandiae TaxID=153914 RepID=A0AA39PFD0_9AGAR|nr:hypothetical protein IW261DRAFT_1461947 [Armillaria novae-zelandiae]
MKRHPTMLTMAVLSAQAYGPNLEGGAWLVCRLSSIINVLLKSVSSDMQPKYHHHFSGNESARKTAYENGHSGRVHFILLKSTSTACRCTFHAESRDTIETVESSLILFSLSRIPEDLLWLA